MQVGGDGFTSVLALVLDPLYRFNPFFTIYYNPFIKDPRPEATEKPYYNYIHQVALVLDAVPRRRVRVLVGDEVGLGKTIEAIRLAKYLATIGEARRILIIAPRSLIRQWLVHEIRDLMHVPGRVKRLTKKSFEEVERALKTPTREPLVVLASIDLVKRGELDRHRGGRFSPYYELVASTQWDLVVVDEAHQISFVSPRPTLRARRLAPLCEKAKHLLLLSATPSRGTHRDFIQRLSLVNPELGKHIGVILRDPARRRAFYDVASGLLVYRRTKDHVNLLEGRRVFTDVKCYMVLVKLGELRELYDELGYVVSGVLRALEKVAPGLVKVVMLKRAVSSPHAFLQTLRRVLEKRVEPAQDSTGRPEYRLTDRVVEERVDAVIAEYLSRVASRLPTDVAAKTGVLVEKFAELFSEGDPAFKALAHILYSVLENPDALPRDLVGDYIVFTEYRDTVDYLFNKLKEFFERAGYVQDNSLPLRLLEHVERKVEERGPVEVKLGKYIPLLSKSLAVMTRGEKSLVLLRISSENQEVIPLIPFLVEAVEEVAGTRVLKVLLSTDVASEGLNLHYFNVVVNYETPWSPVRREQRIGRVHRLRQRRNCAVLDFVRDTQVDYEFYTKLVLKLLEMATQKIAVKPVTGLLEIHYLEKKSSVEGAPELFISEKAIGLLLAEAYKRYYHEGRAGVVDSLYVELAGKLKKYLEVYGELAPRYEEAVTLREYVSDFTGCEGGDCFEEAVRSLYSLLQGPSTGDVSQILVDIYNTVVESRSGRGGEYIVVVNDEALEEGFIGVLELFSEGVKRYETPILVFKERGEWKLVHGIQVLNWLVSAAKNRGILVVPSNTPVSQSELKPLYELAGKYASRLNIWFRERLENRQTALSRLTGSSEKNILKLEWRVRGPVTRIIPGISRLAEYEKAVQELPVEVRRWMEEVSVRLVEELYARRGCKTLEKNVGIPSPYDLLMECVEDGETRMIKVEVKSHLRKAFIAVLTPSETREAEKDPDNYVVCNVAGLGSSDPSTWVVTCEPYSRIPVRKVVEVEEYAVLDFTKCAGSSRPEHGLPS